MGDIVDYAYSIDGASPVSAGRFAERVFLAESAGVVHLTRRIVADDPHRLVLRRHDAGEPAESSERGAHVYAWDRHDVPATEEEDDVPSWYVPVPWVDVSEFASWVEVARSVAPLFRDTDLSGEMSALVAKWKAESPSDEERALAATTFVQDEVRYLGIEIGPHSHAPFSPATVLSRRFGDCKDKALLLATLLRALGMQAEPVLVNTEARRTLDDRLPSPFAFDHAIVRAVVGGATRWIDATMSFQRGELARWEAPRYERALVMSPGAEGLVPIPATPRKTPTYDVDETFTVPSAPGAPVALQVVTTYRGADANGMRADLASSSAGQMARNYLNYYAKRDPKITPTTETTFADDPAANVIVARESYSIPDFFTDGGRDFWPEAIDKHLQRPRIVIRKMPLAVAFPLLVAHHTHVRLASGWKASPLTTDLADDATSFHASRSMDGDTLTLDYRFETLADDVPVAKVADHLATIEKVRDATSFRLDADDARGQKVARVDSRASWFLTGGMVLLGAGTVFFRWVVAWRRDRRRAATKKQSALQAGEAPTCAIAVADDGEIAGRLAAMRCACRGALAVREGAAPPEDLRFGGAIVRSVPAACAACGTGRKVYFQLRSL